ncbi:hypothetical protein Q7C36_010862 [Tachysurus vachellii]|uniref:Uncharacterized protein n=1 Tax=Tachysurus vachellii TaxID=175792 RepID=A0AA88N1L0_TACVA|nr:hypothetical protein Q7C36_010862 [Tachysurus vachellii]
MRGTDRARLPDARSLANQKRGAARAREADRLAAPSCAPPVRLSHPPVTVHICSARLREQLVAPPGGLTPARDVLGRSITRNPVHGCVRSVFAWLNLRDN